MIKRLELTDFESHKHTVIDDFSDGLNLIVGDSNSGKSSMLRAIKLAAYNMFDTASVRIGAKFCIVRIDTDKGYVKVKRGQKVNEWEVCRIGEAPVKFEKVGKNIVPQAAEVIGLKMVTLGDVEFPVNVMSQLESHFMLSGVGDKNATGSMRSQIIDEISGLSGLETLVKEVAGDTIRFARERNELVDKQHEIEEQIVPDDVFTNEDALLTEAEGHIDKHESLLRVLNEAEACLSKWRTLSDNLSMRQSDISRLPDVSGLKDKLDECADNFGRIREMNAVVNKFSSDNSRLTIAQKAVSILPNVSEVEAKASRVEVLMSHARIIYDMVKAHNTCLSKMKIATKRFENLPEVSSLDSSLAEDFVELSNCAHMVELKKKHAVASRKLSEKKSETFPNRDKAVVNLDRAEIFCKAWSEAVEKSEKLSQLRRSLEVLENRKSLVAKQLSDAENEVEESMANVKVCPLTLKPLTSECLANKL